MGMARNPNPTRGVRLGDLDKGSEYVLAYVGRRWEVVSRITAERTLVPYVPPLTSDG